MEERFVISEPELRAIQGELKERGLTLDDISSRIDTSFRNCLYKGTSLDRDSLDRLRELYGKPIDFQREYFINGSGFQDEVSYQLNEDMAELVGYLLGDGSISQYSDKTNSRHIANYYIAITLHEEEDRIQKRVESLIKSILNTEPNIENIRGQKIVQLKLYGKKFVELFESIGLEAGDKVENQVSVPNWIKDKNSLEKRCLKGLIDTDGSIYRRSQDEYIVVNFKNRSKPLLKDFETMCRDINIKTSKAGEYDRQIASQEEVKKFFRKINPLKGREIQI